MTTIKFTQLMRVVMHFMTISRSTAQNTPVTGSLIIKPMMEYAL
jgi:hypothetical protein